MNYLSDYTVIDLETTGVNPYFDKIIEVSALRVRNGVVESKYSALVRTDKIISADVSQLTGITNDMLSNENDIEAVLPLFMDFLGDDIIVGHNVSFDIRFLVNALAAPLNRDVIDTLALSKSAFPEERHHNLSHMVKLLGLQDGEYHRALTDCYHTYNILEKLKATSHEQIIPAQIKILPTVKSFHAAPSATTQSINVLQGVIYGAICDNVLTEDEVLALNEWLNDNKNLAGNYPFDVLYTEIEKILEDGIIEKAELDRLIVLLKELSDPVASREDKSNKDVGLEGKVVCLSGDFVNGSKSHISDIMQKQGATVVNSVTKKTDILVIGGKGNENWAYGNYGNKVKKALELQNAGIKIQIVREEELDLWNS